MGGGGMTVMAGRDRKGHGEGVGGMTDQEKCEQNFL